MGFDHWMDEIGRVCELQFGISIHELPDMCFRDAYDSGTSPSEFMADNLPDPEALRELILS